MSNNYKEPYVKRSKSDLQKVSNLLSIVKNNLGVDDTIKIMELREIWTKTVDLLIAKSSQPAYFDRGEILVINVFNSSLATELSMQKSSILAKLKEATKNTNISFRDIRFKLTTNK
jgi:predicted nucleic acid-binding Zn ribbon protein